MHNVVKTKNNESGIENIMQKEELSIKGLYKITQKDLERCANVAAQAFLDDESSKFLLSSTLTLKTLYEYYLLILKTAHTKMYMFADCFEINSFIVIAPITNADLSIWDCIMSCGLMPVINLGFKIIQRSLEYEKNCIKLRTGIVSNDCWYIFQFGVLPEKQGKKFGSKIIKPVLSWFDSKKIVCYLETQKVVNVEIYSHLGFSLKGTNVFSDNKIKQFGMLR